MAHLLDDRVQETSTSTGTGAFTLAGAVTGFRTFASQLAVNDTTYYLIEAVDANGVPTGEWETGIGTYSATNTLTRTTVLESSNANTTVTFSAGTKRVAMVLPAKGFEAGATANTAATSSAASASFSTAVTTVRTLTTKPGEVVAGAEYEFFASLRVINTATATDLVLSIAVGATNVVTLTQALGTTANASPGRSVIVEGRLTFYSATQAEAAITAYTGTAVVFNAVTNTSASITVAAAGATALNLNVNTSGATSTVIVRQATIQRVK